MNVRLGSNHSHGANCPWVLVMAKSTGKKILWSFKLEALYPEGAKRS